MQNFPSLLHSAALVVGLILGLSGATAADDKDKKKDKKKEKPAKLYLVEMKTSLGTIELELNRAKAPKTVDNFRKWAKNNYYAGTLFHRVDQGYFIQAGGFVRTTTGKCVRKQAKDRKAIKSEAKNGLKNSKGTITAARWAGHPDSASTEFFINLADNHNIDHPLPDGDGYTVFGKVTKGMDIVEKIGAVEVGSGQLYYPVTGKDKKDEFRTVEIDSHPNEDVVIESVSVEAKKEEK